MIKLIPAVFEKPWGWERWLVSTHPTGRSTDPSGRSLSAILGADYPLLVKLIRADDRLSVQVHPDDTLAACREHSRGKTECWLVLDAAPGAWLLAGFRDDCTASPETLREAVRRDVQMGTLGDRLKKYPARPGDFLYIPAGTVHAIGGGVRLLEIQQSSDITYRLYDWGRGRELHVEKALEAIRPVPPQYIPHFAGHFECPHFTLDLVDGGGYTGGGTTDFCLVILAGQGCIQSQCAGTASQRLLAAPEDAIFCRAREELCLADNMRALLIRAEKFHTPLP
ncbi:MAG: class I mannose-6-phosphate isomerase [Spirochaetaceae bacterium]|jgi:mannose-6-phosphate isomerase|nr:class I mannose-6-phosphate isomerase [Spirochaetaceae bacterium]